MNKIVENMVNRRSVRSFTEEKVDVEILKEIVKCGLYAPSSKNKQSWHFTVIQNQEILETFNKDTKDAIKKYATEKVTDESKLKKLMSRANNDEYDTFYKAPVAIIVSIDKSNKSSLKDCAVASQNLMLAAESFGLGSCWMSFMKHLFNLDKVKGAEYYKKFEIPENHVPAYAIVIGHKRSKDIKVMDRRENTVMYLL